MKNETALGHVLTLMTIIIWGTTFVSTKVLLEAFTPIEILFFRFTLGYLSLWAIYPRKGTYGTLRQELLFAAAGLCGVTLYFLLENIALTYTFASNVGVIISIAPFFTAFLANWLLDGEPLRKRFFVGFAAALTGIILIGLNGNFVLKLNPVGDILATLAAVVWAFVRFAGPHLGNTTETLGAVCVGVATYAVLAFALRALSPEELSMIPGGGKLLRWMDRFGGKKA